MLDYIISFLKQELREDINNKHKFILWLEFLKKNKYGKILCINLFLDLRIEHLEKSTIVEIINKISGTITDGREAFGKIAENNQKKILCCNLQGHQ
ncbi:unnamed protein product, partial [marine sediment metagenome]